MLFVKSYDEFVLEHHHILSGENDLSVLTQDLADFIRWQVTHSTKKKKEYDQKKKILYYQWNYPEIVEWFEKEKRKFNYPLFLVEKRSTISVKISVGRLVKGRRNQHDDLKTISLKGNERASHSSKFIDKKQGNKNHTIYLNTYFLSKENKQEVLDFIKSDRFLTELEGTVRHELMHAYDTYKMPKAQRDAVDKMKKVYKQYRADFEIGKSYLKFDGYGEWNGKQFTPNNDFINEGNNHKTFYYICLYYLAKTEMHSYLQTFCNQIQATDKSSPFLSDIYKRYQTIQKLLVMDKDSEAKFVDDSFKKDFGSLYPKLKPTDDNSKFLSKLNLLFLEEVEKEIKKFHKLFFDLKEMK